MRFVILTHKGRAAMGRQVSNPADDLPRVRSMITMTALLQQILSEARPGSGGRAVHPSRIASARWLFFRRERLTGEGKSCSGRSESGPSSARRCLNTLALCHRCGRADAADPSPAPRIQTQQRPAPVRLPRRNS